MKLEELNFLTPNRKRIGVPGITISRAVYLTTSTKAKQYRSNHSKILLTSYFDRYKNEEGRINVGLAYDTQSVFIVINGPKGKPFYATAKDRSISNHKAITQILQAFGIDATRPVSVNTELETRFVMQNQEETIVYKFKYQNHEYRKTKEFKTTK